MVTAQQYLNLIPSANASKPNFTAALTALLQPMADIQNVLLGMPAGFDLDTAVGQQLDFVGQWVGVSRQLNVPIAAYFTLDYSGLGFDQGVWYAYPDPLEGVALLDDATYRTLLYAKIAANMWNGTLTDAQAILADVFVNLPGTNVFIQDNLDMSITIGVTGNAPSALFQAMLQDGYFYVRGAGVLLAGVFIGTGPFFGMDVENYNISGFDVGFWAGTGVG